MSSEEVSPASGTEEETINDNSPAATEETPPDAPAEEGAGAAAKDGDAAAAEPKAKKKRTPKPKKPIEAPKIQKASGYPKTADMIIYAIESLGERKGSSVQGIKNFILKTYPTVKKEKLKKMLKATLPLCVDQGAIIRPDGQEDMAAMAGRYKLVKAAKSTNPSCEEMVVAAVGAMDERKGATVNSIKAWILDNYDHVRPEMLRHQVRIGLTKAQAKGTVAPHTPGKEGAKVSLAARWHIKGEAKKELLKKQADDRKAEAAKKKAAAARAPAKKKAAPPKAKKAAARKKPAPKAAPKKAAPKRRRR